MDRKRYYGRLKMLLKKYPKSEVYYIGGSYIFASINQFCCIIFIFFSLKHPAKYIGKKPRKYTIPAKPLAPNINDQVRIYSTNSTSGDGQVMHNTHSSQYLRVRLNLQQKRRHFLRVPKLDYYSNTCSELLCGLSILSVPFFYQHAFSIPYSIFSQVRLSYLIWFMPWLFKTYVMMALVMIWNLTHFNDVCNWDHMLKLLFNFSAFFVKFSNESLTLYCDTNTFSTRCIKTRSKTRVFPYSRVKKYVLQWNLLILTWKVHLHIFSWKKLPNQLFSPKFQCRK